MKQKTAIRELIEEMEVLLTLPYIKPQNAINDCINLAFAKLEKEKKQIVEAFKNGELPPLFVNVSAEQYYNEIYEK